MRFRKCQKVRGFGRRNRYLTTPAYHAMQGLITAANHRYDIAVVDIGMPDMSGLELLAEFIQLQRFPVIVLSGYNNVELKSEAMRLGATKYFLKPTLTKHLESAIRGLLFDHGLKIAVPQIRYKIGNMTNGQI
jgi:DNA-binding response OmpR family regulator